MSSVLPVYRRSDLIITRGEGVYLFAEDGARYLDFASGIAVNSLGHGHPHLVAALKKQAETLWHCSNLYRMPGLERLANRLTEACGMDRAFFCNSGSEAVECGLKMLRKYHDAAGNPQRYRVITMEGGFHGRTLACISAGGNEVARQGYEPLLDGFDRVTFGDAQAVAQAIGPQTAGILVEPIQGEGGVRVAPEGFLRSLRELADRHGLLLFIDEVQCGMGRTGALFAHRQAGVRADIISAAKGIGGGFPMAACLSAERVASAMTPGSHGSTYGSNPLAMAVGNAVLDILLADGFFAQVSRIGGLLRQGLEAVMTDYPGVITQVRGEGLMLGIRVSAGARPMADALRAHGLLTAPAEDAVVRIIPPLIIDENHINEALEKLRAACKEMQ